jgi:hypothetical protein
MRFLVRAGIALVLATTAGLVAPATAATAATADGPMTLRQYVTQREAARAAAARGEATIAADCYDVYFRSLANNRYVTTELNATGIRDNMLRARGTAVGAWEKYRLCYDTAFDYIYSWAADMYITTEVNYTTFDNMLRARTHVVGDWEKYVVGCVSDGCYIYSIAAARYVTVEINYTGSDQGMLRARGATVGAWELFE